MWHSVHQEEPLPPYVDITALQRVAEYVLKFVDLAAPSTAVYIMRQLGDTVSQAPQLSSSVSLERRGCVCGVE